MSDTLIFRRIDAALDAMSEKKMEVRRINLTDADHELLAKATSYHWRKHTGSKARAIPLSYRDHLIFRSVRKSSIYSTHGVEQVIPQRLKGPMP